LREAADDPLPPTAANELVPKGEGAGAVPEALVVEPHNEAGLLAGNALLPLAVATAGNDENGELVEEAADDPLPPTAANELVPKGEGAGAVPEALVVEPHSEAGLLAGNELLPLAVATAGNENGELVEEAAVDKRLGAVGAAVA